MMRALLRACAALLLAGATLLVVTFGALVAFAEMVAREIEAPEAAPLVLVLGGGVREDGVLHPRSRERVDTAIRLWRQGRVERLHFTGGAFGPIPEAEAMRTRAMERGVPEAAITVETRSETTIQNALFTIREIGPPPPGTVLLTSASHLPRAWATFLWAGARDHRVYPADPWQRESAEDRLRFFAREALAVWYNAARMAWASLRLAAGADPEAVAASLGRAEAAWGPPS